MEEPEVLPVSMFLERWKLRNTPAAMQGDDAMRYKTYGISERANVKYRAAFANGVSPDPELRLLAYDGLEHL